MRSSPLLTNLDKRFMTMNRCFHMPLSTLLLLVFVATAWTAAAQDMHEIKIQDGTVYIDERPVPSDELPPSLEVDGFNVTLSFAGAALLEFNGRTYKLAGSRLVEVDEADKNGDITVYFREEADGGRVQAVGQSGAVSFYALDAGAAEGFVMKEYSKDLYNRAVELQKLSKEVAGAPSPEAGRLFQQLQLKAEQNARVAGALPQLELQSYLFDVQQENGRLYEQLLRESTLEKETLNLAGRIRSLGEGADRTRLVGQLSEMLNESFDLKQQNRLAEIQQLEGRLEALQQRLKEREAMRDRIIDRRLKELIGTYKTRDW